MAGRLLVRTLRQNVQVPARSASQFYDKIGSRDVVGHGWNGEPAYLDRADFPMPAIRFKENTPDVMALREKEKGDWRKLSLEEKKALYRASFRQTFAEVDAPNGQLKAAFGVALMGVSLGFWLFYFMKAFVYEPLPESFQEEHQVAQLKRMKLLDVNPITGMNARK